MKQIKQTEDLRAIGDAERLLVVHADAGWLKPVLDGEFDFFTRLTPFIQKQNIATVVVEIDTPLSEALLTQQHLHLIFADRPSYRPNALHVAPAYIWGFWYLDEVGINSNSTLRMRKFGPNDIDWGHAEWFWNGVTSHMLGENISRALQSDRAPYVLDRGAAAIFCQDIEHRVPREHYLSTVDIIKNTARATLGGKVYVKLHPYQSAASKLEIEQACDADPNIVLTDASIHDIIQISDWVVTQNSAAGFEALMQRKPVITCARCDYHHATKVARTTEELREILRHGPGDLEHFQFEKYFYWFLSEHCVEPQRDDFANIVWNRLSDKAMI